MLRLAALTVEARGMLGFLFLFFYAWLQFTISSAALFFDTNRRLLGVRCLGWILALRVTQIDREVISDPLLPRKAPVRAKQTDPLSSVNWQVY